MVPIAEDSAGLIDVDRQVREIGVLLSVYYGLVVEIF
jgi:hypothetical protein